MTKRLVMVRDSVTEADVVFDLNDVAHAVMRPAEDGEGRGPILELTFGSRAPDLTLHARAAELAFDALAEAAQDLTCGENSPVIPLQEAAKEAGLTILGPYRLRHN